VISFVLNAYALQLSDMRQVAKVCSYLNSLRTSVFSAWRIILDIGFTLLSIRLVIAALLSSRSDFLPTIVLLTGGLCVGAWGSKTALFVFTGSVPFLQGLAQDGFVNCSCPVSIVFSGIWLAIAAMEYIRILVARHRTNGHVNNRLIFSPLALCAEILISGTMLSLAWQLWRHSGSGNFWGMLLSRTVPGYGDPLYFLSAAFLWLQGLFYFSLLYRFTADTHTKSGAISSWTAPVGTLYIVTISVFFLIQMISGTPLVGTETGFQACYEDFSSFGSIIVALLIVSLTRLSWKPERNNAFGIAVCSCLLIMLVASWSRAAWLAGGVFSLIIVFVRFPRKISICGILAAVACIAVINLNANRPIVAQQHYLARLAALVRPESLSNKDPARLNLYGKALRVIETHPLRGIGIGSFYLESVDYVMPNDSYWRARTPDFAHNTILQIAAEEGVPLASIFAALIGWVFWSGLRDGLNIRHSNPKALQIQLRILGLTLGLGAYLETQMTANSLNIYVDNQFFFWFLVAAILDSTMVGESAYWDNSA